MPKPTSNQHPMTTRPQRTPTVRFDLTDDSASEDGSRTKRRRVGPSHGPDAWIPGTDAPPLAPTQLHFHAHMAPGRLPVAMLTPAAMAPVPTLPRPGMVPLSVGWPEPDTALSVGPSLYSMTPGGLAWWKFGGAPEPLQGVDMVQPGILPWPVSLALNSSAMRQMRALAHAGDAAGVRHGLIRLEALVRAHHTKKFGTPYEEIDYPTLEQIEQVNDALSIFKALGSHCVVHAIVGAGSVRDKIATLETLRSHGIDLSAVRLESLNLIHLACIIPAMPADRMELIEFLKHAEVDVAERSNLGLTPLHCLAAQPDAIGAAEALAGWIGNLQVDVNATNDAGETPMFVVFATQPGNTAMLKWLRDRGARMPRTTQNGDTVLHAVMRHGDHAQLVLGLMKQNVSPTEANQLGVTAIALSRQLERSWSLRAIKALAIARCDAARQGPHYLGSTEATAVPPPGPMIPTPGFVQNRGGRF